MKSRSDVALSLGLLVALCMLLFAVAGQADTIVNSKHNLSATGPGTVRATAESEVCIFCHTPHNAAPETPLWNRNVPGDNYIPYATESLDAAVGQPTGSSKLCLSCHDGTIALGQVLSRAMPIAMQGGQDVMPVGPALIGTDLSDDHPVSFDYDGLLAVADPELRHPGTLTGAVELDSVGQLQCRSCHDPHDDQFGDFLVVENFRSALCLECHQKLGWDFTSHKLSAAMWNGQDPDPWPTTEYTDVQDNGCENCHQPHTAPSGDWLLHEVFEEDNCFSCHNGNVSGVDIEVEFAKTSRHPIALTSGEHSPTENPDTMTRHVECADCHNPHATRDAPEIPPAVAGELEYVAGVNLNSVDVSQATYTYEVCFKCHADGAGNPGSFLPRVIPQSNTRLEFQPTNPSFHPVAAAGNNPNVPSLISPYTTSSIISCVDCHGNNSGPGAGGTGPAGPHGSMWDPILERRYNTQDNVRESSQLYALCYKCHSRSSILNDDSFGEHDKHIRGDDTACSVCHDAHGISNMDGNSTNNSHLINFRSDVVFPNSQGRLEFIDQGLYAGTCNLMCHGEDHLNESYPRN